MSEYQRAEMDIRNAYLILERYQDEPVIAIVRTHLYYARHILGAVIDRDRAMHPERPPGKPLVTTTY